MSHVVDASALLAVLLHEPGADKAGRLLEGSIIGAVNLAEVAAGLRGDGNDDAHIREIIDRIELPIAPADAELALDAGLLRGTTDAFGLSLGDRFCLALGRRTGAPVLTADRVWAEVAPQLGITVELIR
jgi:ribonuclease VapC